MTNMLTDEALQDLKKSQYFICSKDAAEKEYSETGNIIPEMKEIILRDGREMCEHLWKSQYIWLSIHIWERRKGLYHFFLFKSETVQKIL